MITMPSLTLIVRSGGAREGAMKRGLGSQSQRTGTWISGHEKLVYKYILWMPKMSNGYFRPFVETLQKVQLHVKVVAQAVRRLYLQQIQGHGTQEH
jgi:hypothetical protein